MITTWRSSAGAVLAAAVLLAAPHVARAAPLEVSRDDAGWTVKATGVRIEDVLQALAEQEPFGVAMQLGVERPLVDVDVRRASLDGVLRHVLRGRNYTIGYREDGGELAVSRVEVMLPRPSADIVQAASTRRADLAAELAARRATELQRQREQQVYARVRAANAAARSAARREQQARPIAVQPQPLPLRRQLWQRGWSGSR